MRYPASDVSKGLAVAWGVLAVGGYVLGTVIVSVVRIDPVAAGAASTALFTALANVGLVLYLEEPPGPPPGGPEVHP